MLEAYTFSRSHAVAFFAMSSSLSKLWRMYDPRMSTSISPSCLWKKVYLCMWYCYYVDFLASLMPQFNLHFPNRSVTDAEPSCYLFVGICFVHSNCVSESAVYCSKQIVWHLGFVQVVLNSKATCSEEADARLRWSPGLGTGAGMLCTVDILRTTTCEVPH